MKDAILKFIRDKELVRQLWNVIRMCWAALGMVYLLGRMLNIVKLPIHKNAVGALFLLINALCIIFIENELKKSHFAYQLWSVYLYFTIGITIYVWIFWKSYDRIDYLLDKKGLRDKGVRNWFKKKRNSK